MLFTIVEDAHVIVCRQGVFRQCDVYQRGERLYAQLSRSSFVGLRDNRATTHPKVYWDFIDIEYDVERVSSAIILRGVVRESCRLLRNSRRVACCLRIRTY
jgi:hypothetical protein